QEQFAGRSHISNTVPDITPKFFAKDRLHVNLRWTPSLTCPWNPRQLLRSLLDGHRAQCTFHCSLRVLLSLGHDANDHNLLLKGAPFYNAISSPTDNQLDFVTNR